MTYKCQFDLITDYNDGQDEQEDEKQNAESGEGKTEEN